MQKIKCEFVAELIGSNTRGNKIQTDFSSTRYIRSHTSYDKSAGQNPVI